MKNYTDRVISDLKRRWGARYDQNFKAAEAGWNRVLRTVDQATLNKLEAVFADPVESIEVLRKIGLEGRPDGVCRKLSELLQKPEFFKNITKNKCSVRNFYPHEIHETCSFDKTIISMLISELLSPNMNLFKKKVGIVGSPKPE